MLNRLAAADFRKHLDEPFVLAVAEQDEALSLTLVEVSELGASTGGPRPQAFSLIFHVPGGVYLPQQIYTLRHEKMGELGLFLAPLQPDEQGMRVEAIFN